MNYKIVYIVFGGIMLVSCGNTNTKVKEQTLDEIVGNKLESKVTSPTTAVENEKPVPAKPSYKEWKFSYGKDEFGDQNENIKYITLYLDAIRPNHEDEREYISIDYVLNKDKGIECFIFSSSELGKTYKEISVKQEDGSQYVFNGIDTGSYSQGAVAFTDVDDVKQISGILSNGNFKLKVGNRVAKVKNETKGFRESVEKYFKGEDIEVLLSRITRE